MGTEPLDSESQDELRAGTLTFLMTDIVDSTSLWDTRPADMAQALRQVEGVIEESVVAAGGRLLKSRGEGDSTLSVFTSAPAAVGAAVGLVRAIEIAILPNEIVLSVRCGVHSGEVQQRDGDYFGGTLNRSARIRGLANGGQILISGTAAELVDGLLDDKITLADLGVHELRGLSRPERVHQVCHPDLTPDFPPIGADSAAAVSLATGADVPLPTALDMFRTGPFAGREDKLELLRSAWEAARSSGPRLTVVGGEPGIGKTRLVVELAQELHDSGATVLAGRCTEDPIRPFEPFADAFHSYARALEPAILAARLARPGDPLSKLLPDLAGGAATSTPLTRSERQARGEDRASFLDAMVALLDELTFEAPAVLVIEDLHWATEATLVALRNLLSSPVGMPLMILGTYRDSELARTHPFAATLADLRRDNRVIRVPLRGLDESAIATCLAAQDDLDVTEGLARMLREQTDGNPFFLGEILRHLAETDGTDMLPEGVREVIGRRLSTLGDIGVKALRAAAVLGPTFSFRLLEEMPAAGEDADDLLDAMDAAVAAHLIVEERGDRSGNYSFAHALVRQTVYEELSSARRTRLHAQALAAIEAVHGRSGAWLSPLAHHSIEAARAGDLDRVVEYVELAARTSLDGFAAQEAVELCRSGLEVLQLAPPSPGGEARLLTVLGSAVALSGEKDEGKQILRRALELARASTDDEAFASAADAVAEWEGALGYSNQELVALIEEAVARLGDEHRAKRAELLASLSWLVLEDANDPASAERFSLQAVSDAEQSDDPMGLVWPLFAREQLMWGAARHSERLAVFDRLARIDMSENRLSAARVEMTRSRLRFELGETDARMCLFSALEDWTGNVGTIDLWGAFLALLDGDLERAAEINGQALPKLVHANEVALGLSQMFMIMRERGQMGAAIDIAEETVASTPGLEGFVIALALGRAEVGDTAEARSRLDELAVRGFARLRADMTVPVSRMILAELIAKLGATRHISQLEPLLVPFSGTGIVVGYNGAFIGAADRGLGQLAATDGRLTDALHHYEQAIDFEQRIEAYAPLARTRYWYARALLTGGSEQARRGHEVLDEALNAASEFGMAGLVADLAELAAQHDHEE